MRDDLPLSVTHEVRDTCLCLHLQRAARVSARLFDDAFRPLGLTNGQFSLLMSLNRPDAPRVGDVAAMLAMDRTTLTAALKPIERRGLVAVERDPRDRRGRRLRITGAGRALLVAAMPIWRRTHAELAKRLTTGGADRLRADLLELSRSIDKAKEIDMNLAPYLFMNGTCEEAFTAYADLLGGKVEAMMTYEGTPAEAHVPADWRDKVMHACLNFGDQMLMGSDSSPGMQKQPGGFSVSIHLEDPAEAERIFAGLSEGGTVTMPMEETFWAKRFGAVTDRFGTPWLINCAPAA